jgi:hypothetical protein
MKPEGSLPHLQEFVFFPVLSHTDTVHAFITLSKFHFNIVPQSTPGTPY